MLGRICAALHDTGEGVAGFTLHHGCLLYKGRVAIPATSPLVEKLLLEYHTTAIGGHNGEYKTYRRLAEDWFWEA